MKKMPNITLGILLVITLALGSFIGNNLQHLRESEAFYRWLYSAGTNARLFESTSASNQYDDANLYKAFGAVAADQLQNVDWDKVEGLAGPDAFASFGTTPLAELTPEQQVTILTDIPEMDALLWDIARGPGQAENRTSFLDGARESRLEFAKGIKYADAQAGGVNVFNLFFGFRQVAATLLWIKVDTLWHQGNDHAMNPLMKTCVVLDPQFVDAYLLGAWHLAFNVTAKMPATPQPSLVWNEDWQACVGEKETLYYVAADFLKDGIRNNPRNYKLYFDLGYGIYSLKLSDYPNAIRYLEEAVRKPHERWVPRMLYNSYEANDDYAKAIQGWEGYMARFPEDAQSVIDTAPRSIKRNRARHYTQLADDAYNAAQAATDPATEQAKSEEANTYLAQATQIWEEMGDDPVALAQLKKFEAQGMARNGDYMLAITKLDLARWDYPADAFFIEASDLIIDYKILAGMPLSISEKKAQLRNAGGEGCRGKPEPESA